MSDPDGVVIRPVTPEDVNFVICNWLEGYWDSGPFSLVMPKSKWWHRWHIVVENALADERNKTLVACSSVNDSRLYGFICARPPGLLHWLYVKQTYRGRGISRWLQADAGLGAKIVLSAWSEGARRMALANPDVTYDPRIIKEYA